MGLILGSVPIAIVRLDLAAGSRMPWMTIARTDSAGCGMPLPRSLYLTNDRQLAVESDGSTALYSPSSILDETTGYFGDDADERMVGDEGCGRSGTAAKAGGPAAVSAAGRGVLGVPPMPTETIV